MEELAQELVRDEVAQTVEELDLGDGVVENDSQRTPPPRALGRAKVEVELVVVEAEDEREQLEELNALILVEFGITPIVSMRLRTWSLDALRAKLA